MPCRYLAFARPACVRTTPAVHAPTHAVVRAYTTVPFVTLVYVKT